MLNLSTKQQLILDFLKSEVSKKGYAPTVREICEHVGLKSSSTVHSHLNKLEKHGYIKKDPNKPRAITILHNNFQKNIGDILYLPLIKDPTLKDLFETSNITKYIPISSTFTNYKFDFLYENKGNRLNNLGVSDNDYVIINKSINFEDSSLYLITLYDEFVSLRKVLKDNDDYKLYTDANCITVSSNDVKFIGKVVGVLKNNK